MTDIPIRCRSPDGPVGSREHLASEMRALLNTVQSQIRAWLATPAVLEPPYLKCALCRAQVHLIAQRTGSAGLTAYASLCARIAEKLEPLFRLHGLPRSAMDLLWQWSQLSLRYLDGASDHAHAAELVALLNEPPSADSYGDEELARLLEDLIEDRNRFALASSGAGRA